MEIELKNIQTKEEAIKYIEQEVDKLDYMNIWDSQIEFENKIFGNLGIFSEFLSDDEMLQIYYNQFIKVLGQKDMHAEDKVRTFIDFNEMFAGEMKLKKELINKDKMEILAKQIFKSLPFEWQERIAEYTTDEEKIQFLDEYKDNLNRKFRFNIIKSIQKDDLKLKKLKDEDFNYLYKLKIITTLKEDKEKVKMLSQIEKKLQKTKLDKNLMLINPEDILYLISTLNNQNYIKDFFKRMISIKSIKDEIKTYPSILPISFFKNIKDDKLVFELIKDLKTDEIELSMNNIVKSIKTSEGMNILNKKYMLSQSQKIALAFKVIRNEEEQIKWIKENTSLEEKLYKVSQKEYNNNDMELPRELTIGVELEAEGVTPDNVRKIIRNMPVKKGIFGKWRIKEDGSLVYGTEITSPVLNSEKDNLNELEYVCDFMNAIGMDTSQNCGGHIHYGASFLKNNLKSWKNLISIWCETEELIYKMSNDIGQAPRYGIFEYARKESENIEKMYKDGSLKLETDKDFIELVSKMAPERYYGINLINLEHPKKNTIEIRIPNGTINPKVQKENIKFFGKIISRSKEICTNEKLQQKYEKLKDHELSEEEKVEAFLDLLFEKEEDKEIYRNRWQSVRHYEIFDGIKAEKPKFKREEIEEHEL